MSERSSDVFFWKVSLGIIGFLLSALTPAFAPQFPQLIAGIVFVGLGFVAGGVIGRSWDSERPPHASNVE